VNINPARESIDGLSQHLDVVRDEHGTVCAVATMGLAYILGLRAARSMHIDRWPIAPSIAGYLHCLGTARRFQSVKSASTQLHYGNSTFAANAML